MRLSAYTTPNRVGSVVFFLDGKKVRTENGGPYALAGDNPSGDYHEWTPSLGYHTLTATPYSKSFGKGTEGISLTIHFTVVNNKTDIITGRENPAVDAEGLSLKIIPNPAMNMLTVFTGGITLNNKAIISIVSSSGTVVRTMIPNGQGQKVQLDISTLAKGTYFVKMVNGNTVMIKPFVKL
ncbi:hypothetical protein BH20BAC1_BH20BAC1_21630 [soil metagenome]